MLIKVNLRTQMSDKLKFDKISMDYHIQNKKIKSILLNANLQLYTFARQR